MPLKSRQSIDRRRFLATWASLTAGLMLPSIASAVEKKKVFRAGAAASNITPLLGVTMDGPIMQIGGATHVHDELHARALVLDDGNERIAIVVCDSTLISRDLIEQAKQRIQRDTGLATDRILISATHTHSTPRLVGIGTTVLDKQYEQFVVHRIADGVRRAINNLAPAKIGWGTGSKPEWLFNRRWYVKPGSASVNPFGITSEQVQMNPRRGGTNLVKPAGPVDPQVSVLSVQHADGTPLALLANFGIHYVGGTMRAHVSADYFGAFAREIEDRLGHRDDKPPFVGILSNGTSGDISNGLTFLKPPARRKPYERIREVAHSLANEVLRVEKQIQYRDGVPLAMQQVELELATRRPDAQRLAWAKRINQQVAQKKPKRLTRPQIYAREASFLEQYPPTTKIVLQAIRLGDLGIAAIPCEVFAETGLAIKAESPLKPTFTIELANGYGGYLPTPEQHRLGGYETWPARSSFLEVGAEPKIRAAVLDLLSSVAKK